MTLYDEYKQYLADAEQVQRDLETGRRVPQDMAEIVTRLPARDTDSLNCDNRRER